MEKLERDGKVAVVYSPGFGAGWSTWNRGSREMAAWLAMSREVAELVERGALAELRALVNARYPVGYFAVHGLEIEWVDKGQVFKIEEYDGSESVTLVHDLDLMEA